MIYDDCGCPPDGDSAFCSGPEYVECTTCWKKWIEKNRLPVDEAMRIAKAAKHVQMCLASDYVKKTEPLRNQ